MKVATGVVLLCLFAVVAETTTKAASDTTVVKGTRDDIITHGISTHDFSTTSITTGRTIPEGTTNTSTTSTHNTPATKILTSADTTRHTILETTKSLFTTTTTPLITTTTITTITNPQTTTKAATDTTIVKGTREDIITHGISTHDFSTTSITTRHTTPEGTTNTSTTSTHNTPATTILTSADTTRHTILETTKSLFTTTTTPLITTTTTTTITNPRLCQNEGYYDGIKCICPDVFFGPLCENIIDRFEFGTTVQTTVKVELRFMNKEFDENFNNSQSNEYKEFEKEFKGDMNIVYKVISGYRDVNILSIRPGSVIVDHEVMVDIVYNANITVTEQYKNILQDVKKELNKIVCGKTTQTMINDCISDILTVTEGVPPKNEDDICSSVVPPGFQEFYTSLITEGGLFCVSHCHTESPKFMNCNGGTCHIKRGTGLQCLCPYTESYMYTKPQCTGKISKTVLLVSVGVTIGILLIVLVILVIFCFRMKTKAPKLLTEEEMYYSTIKG